MGGVGPITENFDNSRVDWWRLRSNSWSFRWSGPRFSITSAVSFSSGILTLLIGSSLPPHVEGKERSDGLRISGGFSNAPFVFDPLSFATCLSTP